MRNFRLSFAPAIIAVCAVSPAAFAQDSGLLPMPPLPWLVTGNKVAPGDFLGTTNNEPLVLKAGGSAGLSIQPNGDVLIGATSANALLSVGPPGTGNGIFGQSTSDSAAGLYASGTGLQGYGVYAVSSGSNSVAVQGYNTGTGNAGQFYMDNPNISNSGSVTSIANAVLYAETNAGSTENAGYYGPAAAFIVQNQLNLSPAIYTQGAGNFYMNNPNVPNSGSQISTANAVVYAETNAGSTSTNGYYGPAAAFVVNNGANASPAVYAQGSSNDGSDSGGVGVYGTGGASRTGSGTAGVYGAGGGGYNGAGAGVYGVGGFSTINNGGIGVYGEAGTSFVGNVGIGVEGYATPSGSEGAAAVFVGGSGGSDECIFSGSSGWDCGPAAPKMLKHSERVDPEAVLRQLAAMPLYYYGMKDAHDTTVRYLGPSAEDFKAAFDLGPSDRTINSGNAQGVAFAAIQGLYRQLQAKDREIAELKAKTAELDARLAAIENQFDGQIALTRQQPSANAVADVQ